MSGSLSSYVSGEKSQMESGSVGTRIVEAREAAGLSTPELAERLGVKASTLRNWEREKSEPRGNRLTMLAGVLCVSPTWLLTGFGEEPSAQSDEELAAVRSSLVELKDQLHGMAERIDRLASRLDAHAQSVDQK